MAVLIFDIGVNWILWRDLWKEIGLLEVNDYTMIVYTGTFRLVGIQIWEIKYTNLKIKLILAL